MKIVIATPFYPPEVGTLATYAQGLEQAFKRQGHEVRVVSLGALKSFPRGVRHLMLFFRLLKEARGAAFVLSLDTWTVCMPALGAARVLGVPLCVRIGGDILWEAYVERTGEALRLSDFYAKPCVYSRKERIIAAWLRMLVARADTLFFNSRFQRDLWEKAYDLARKAHILENVYPSKQQTAAPAAKVFVGAVRGARTKNSTILPRVFAEVQKKHPEVELDARELPYDQQLPRLKAAYAIIIPSFSEVNSNMAIEAVSFGRPFIMSEDSGSKERLDGCGLFIDTRSESELIQAVEKLLDPAVYEQLAAKTRAFSFTRSWDDMAEEIVQRI